MLLRNVPRSEFDNGMSHDEAEREAWALVSSRYRLH